MKLIQLPTQAFEQRLKQELEENPALDTGKEKETSDDSIEDFDNSTEDYDDNETIDTDDINIDEYLSDDEIPEYRTQANNYSADDEDKSVPYAAGTSFTQHLINQLNCLFLSR
jgi:RNA polymerase sigma-54 factor